MFPVIVLDKPGKELPKKGIYFVVGKNGLFMHKDMGLIEAMVKVEDISFLQHVVTRARLNIPKIPREIFVQTLSFFRWAQKKFQSEAVVLLHYSPEKGFLLHCPKQKVSSAHVDYAADDRFEGYSLVCSIHSHNNFGAFHSSIDINDEKHFDGLHITVGDVDVEYFTLTSSIAVNNNRFPILPEKVIEGIFEIKPEEKPEELEQETPLVVEDEDGIEDETTLVVEDEDGIEDEIEAVIRGVKNVIDDEAKNVAGEFDFQQEDMQGDIFDPDSDDELPGNQHFQTGLVRSFHYVKPEVYDILGEDGKSCQGKWAHPKEWQKRVKEEKLKIVFVRNKRFPFRGRRGKFQPPKIQPSRPRFQGNAIVKGTIVTPASQTSKQKLIERLKRRIAKRQKVSSVIIPGL